LLAVFDLYICAAGGCITAAKYQARAKVLMSRGNKLFDSITNPMPQQVGFILPEKISSVNKTKL